MGDLDIQVEPDEDGTDEPVVATPPAAPPALPGPPPPAALAVQAPTSLEEALEQIARLTAAVRRNNGELAKRRTVEKWMSQHGIDDLDSWLGRMGIDRETAAPLQTAAGSSPQAPTASPDLDKIKAELEAEATQLREEAAKQQTEAETLRVALRENAIDAALRAARFVGDPKKARRVMDLEGVRVGDNGTVEGAAEAVKALLEEIPEWFRQTLPATPARQRRAVDGGERRPAPPRAKKWDEVVADAFGR